MTDEVQGKPKRQPRKIWNFTPALPIRTAPYFDWPLSPLSSIVHLLNSWNPAGWRFLMLLFAWAVWMWASPSLASIADGGYGWIAFIALRNLAILLIFAGGLHLWLLVWNKQGDETRYDTRPMAKGSKIFHFRSQVWDNVFWSLVAWVFWSFWECLIMWAYATGRAPMLNIAESPVLFTLVTLFIPIWAGVHFYWLHRLLHVGALYTYVHSWHHKNVNTGPWSGLAMHPVESFFLFFDTMLLLVIPGHPVLAIFLLFHHGIGAPVSHAGFEHLTVGKEKLPLGDFFHQLHHRFIDCNFGTWDTPWDQWFGTFHDGTDEGTQHINEMRRKAALRKQGRLEG
jgi:sterol desaturase/sphingolipid hydroxylase (fatty acid hydroxylase superfamily)